MDKREFTMMFQNVEGSIRSHFRGSGVTEEMYADMVAKGKLDLLADAILQLLPEPPEESK